MCRQIALQCIRAGRAKRGRIPRYKHLSDARNHEASSYYPCVISYGGSASRWSVDYKFNYSRRDNTWHLVRSRRPASTPVIRTRLRRPSPPLPSTTERSISRISTRRTGKVKVRNKKNALTIGRSQRRWTWPVSGSASCLEPPTSTSRPYAITSASASPRRLARIKGARLRPGLNILNEEGKGQRALGLRRIYRAWPLIFNPFGMMSGRSLALRRRAKQAPPWAWLRERARHERTTSMSRTRSTTPARGG
jgi:hypothetical protein